MDLSIATVVVQMVNFFIFAAVIGRFFYRPIMRILEERKAKIAREQEEAERLRAAAEKARDDYEKKLRDAQREAQEIIRNAASSGELVKNEIIDQAHKDAQKEKEKALSEIQLERERAQQEMKMVVADLSIAIAQKVLKETIDDASRGQIIKEFIRKVESGNVV
jgi:F-type H+-transporting ATPase subunit b